MYTYISVYAYMYCLLVIVYLTCLSTVLVDVFTICLAEFLYLHSCINLFIRYGAVE